MISLRPIHVVRIKATPELAALLKSNQVFVEAIPIKPIAASDYT